MVYAFLAMILYSLAIVVGSAASRKADTNLVAGFINVVSAIVPFIIAIPFITRRNLTASKHGLLLAAVAGMLIALFSMALTKSYATNKVGVVVPVVFGGAIVLSTLLSAVVFNDKISHVEGFGLLIVAVGFGVIVYARSLTS